MRYFFNLRESDGYIVDEDGLELVCAETARRAGIAGIRSIMAAEVMTGKLPLGSIMEVDDESGNRVHDLAFREAVLVDG